MLLKEKKKVLERSTNMSCPKLDALLCIFNSGFNWLHGFIIFFAHSGLAAKHSHFQFSDQRLNYKPLQTHLFFPLSSWLCSISFFASGRLDLDKPSYPQTPPPQPPTSLYFCLPHCLMSLPPSPPVLLNQGPSQPPSFSLALFTQNAKCLDSNPSSGGDLGFLNWNRRQIKNHWPPPNPNTHPYGLPLPLKLHSNGLNGAFPVRSRADWGRGEGSSWQFMTQLKVICKPCASIMKFPLATVNTGTSCAAV